MTTRTDTDAADYNRYTRDPIYDQSGDIVDDIWTVEQWPRRYSDEWDDPAWRLEWLAGISDTELDMMSHIERGARLPAYAQQDGIAYYGERAQQFCLGADFVSDAHLATLRLQPYQLVQIGCVIQSMMRSSDV